MNNMKWLIRREIWEHKGAFVWTPMVLSALLVLAMLAGLAFAPSPDTHIMMGGLNMHQAAAAMSTHDRAQMISGISQIYIAAGLPLFITLGFTVFFFCVSTLFDERRDRSVLFWKSLPVSDGQTVSAKAVTALLVAPLLVTVLATLTGFIALLVLCVFSSIHGLNLTAALLSSASVYTAPLKLLAVLPVYALWALPSVGWLMLVGAWARSKALLWAIALPVVAGVVISTFASSFGLDSSWFWHNVPGRLLLGVMPGTWLSEASSHASSPSADVLGSMTMGMLSNAKLWVGALCGVAMLYLSVRVRRWKDEG
jgi:ABC-2 type transport system permease protein